MTWVLDSEAAGPSDVFELQPHAYKQLKDVLCASWEMTDPALLRLCCLRMAQILGARLPTAIGDRREELETWWTSERFTPLERAVIAYTEQFLLDPNGVRAEDDAALRELLTLRELVNFVVALNALEEYLRACVLLDVETDVFDFVPTEAAVAVEPEDIGPAPPPEDGVGRRIYRLLLTDERFRDVKAAYGRTAVTLSTVDEVTTEVVRLRNATFQQCHY